MGSFTSKFSRISRDIDADDSNEPAEKYPWYYVKEDVTSEDISIVRHTWELIRDNKSETYLADVGKIKTSCGIWFCNHFYKRLFKVAPETERLFKNTNMAAQAMMLLKMMSFLVGNLGEYDTMSDTLTLLAKTHASYGVKIRHYGIMGEVLVATFEELLGREFDEKSGPAWVRMYSSFLKVIIPVAVAEERRLLLISFAEEHVGSTSKEKPSSSDRKTQKIIEGPGEAPPSSEKCFPIACMK
jgi:hemoglobin-like flavoprotein